MKVMGSFKGKPYKPMNCPTCGVQVEPEIDMQRVAFLTVLTLALIVVCMFALDFLGIDRTPYASIGFWLVAIVLVIFLVPRLPRAVCPKCKANLESMAASKKIVLEKKEIPIKPPKVLPLILIAIGVILLFGGFLFTETVDKLTGLQNAWTTIVILGTVALIGGIVAFILRK